MNNIFCCDLKNRKLLREVMVKIGLKRINTQEKVIVKALLNSGATELVMSLELT